MPVAAKKWFRQSEEMSTDLAKKLSTSMFGIGAMDTLESLGMGREVLGSYQLRANTQ
jgi:hypothetical protein